MDPRGPLQVFRGKWVKLVEIRDKKYKKSDFNTNNTIL